MAMNTNRKGYMLVEIIVAFALTLGIAFFLIELIIKFKNNNDDLLVEMQLETDRTIITNKLYKYAKDSREEFRCENLRKEGNAIYYEEELIDIVNDYADFNSIQCNVDDGSIRINIPITIPQLKNKDYNIDITYSFFNQSKGE